MLSGLNAGNQVRSYRVGREGSGASMLSGLNAGNQADITVDGDFGVKTLQCCPA